MMSGDTSPRDVPWSPMAADSGFQILQRRDLVTRFGDDLWRSPERLEFELVIQCRSGTGIHMVDFTEVHLDSNHVLHIRPGQIHQWRAEPDYQATLLLFRQFRHRPQAHWPSEPKPRELGADQIDRLESAYEMHDALVEPVWAASTGNERRDLALAGVRDIVQAVLGIPTAGDKSGPGGGAYFELRADIERHLDHRHTVQDRAARLGYSTRTLDRACRAVVGVTAKRLVDERLALEARRMLVLPNSQVSAVARSLGFDEATNFTKFVKRTTGRLPTDWQDPQSPA